MPICGIRALGSNLGSEDQSKRRGEELWHKEIGEEEALQKKKLLLCSVELRSILQDIKCVANTLMSRLGRIDLC